MTKKANWKDTISFLKRAKLPWGHYILASIVPFLTTYLYVYLPELEGRIASGEIFDKGLLREYVLVSILMLLLNITTFYSAWVEIQFDKRIQKMTWKKLLLMPMRRFEEAGPSTLISRITDDSTYVSQMVNYILSVVLSIYSAVLMILSLFRMSTVLAGYTVPVMILNFVFVLIARSKGYDVGYSIQEAISNYTSFLSERVYQVPLIKAMGTEGDELTRGCELSDKRRREELRAQRYEIFISITMEVTNILLVGIVLMGGAILVKNGGLEMSSLITFYLLAMSLPNTLQELLFQVLKMQQFHGSVEVITELAGIDDEKSAGSDEPGSLENALSFRDVGFSYDDPSKYFGDEDLRDGGKEVLKGISFDIPKGKVTAIVGSSGSGKTTVLKLLERFYEPDRGEIMYDGRPASEFDLKSWRRHFGYIVQNSPLISGTIRSNILYGAKREFSDDELMEIVKTAELGEFIAEVPGGLDAKVSGNGENLSGGQRQRIAIARALAAEPEILIMDEATSNLDAHNVRSINAALYNLMKGKTVVVVAHQMNTIKNADQIIVMDDGMIEASGTHEELLAKDNTYKRYFEIQNNMIG